MAHETGFSSVPQSHSEENIAKKSLSGSPHSYSSGALSSLDGRTTREIALLNESSQKAHDHLLHVVCRAQTHSKRDLLWYRLLAGGTGEDDKEIKKTRRKSEFRRPIPDLAELWSCGIDVEEFFENQTEVRECFDLSLMLSMITDLLLFIQTELKKRICGCG